MTIKVPGGPKKIKVQRNAVPRRELPKGIPGLERFRKLVFVAGFVLFLTGVALIPVIGMRFFMIGLYALLMALSLFATQIESGRSGFWKTLLVLLFMILVPRLAINKLAAVLVIFAWVFLLIILVRNIWPVFKTETPTWRAAVLLGLVLATQIFLYAVWAVYR